MSNNDKTHFRKHRVTKAEELLKKKHDETRDYIDNMNRRAMTEAELEEKMRKERRAARLAAMRKKQQEEARLAAERAAQEGFSDSSS